MKVNELGWALLAAILLVGFSTPGHAEDKEVTAVPAQEFKAKTDYCKTCHGVSGQGFRGSFPMPRLAGQQPEYLQESVAGVHRAQANQPCDVQRGACSEPADADGFVHAILKISIPSRWEERQRTLWPKGRKSISKA